MSLRRILPALVALTPLTTPAADLPVRAEPPTGQTHYVGGQLRFPVILSLAERPENSPRFDLPQTSGGTLLKLPGSPVYGTAQVGGITMTTWRYDFAYYPHRAGTHTIPAITARVGKLSGHSAAFELRATLPPGAEGLATLVSTTDFVVKESWHPQPGSHATAGDAFTRTITLRAPDVMGMGFPPLPLAKPDGVALYPKAPLVHDRVERGDVRGSRTETLVYVCEAAGEVTLPAITIPWFDLAAGEMRRVELPSHTLKIAAAPARPGDRDAAAAGENAARTPWLAVLLVIMAAAATAATLRFRQRDPDSEPRRFRRLLKAARANDPTATINLAPAWLQSLPGADKPRTLRDLAPGDALDALFAAGYAPAPASRWDGRNFARHLVAARRQHQNQRQTRPPALAPLNP